MVSPVVSPNSLPSTAPMFRPNWLPEEQTLREYLRQLAIPISTLGTNLNGSKLVDDVLQQVIRDQNTEFAGSKGNGISVRSPPLTPISQVNDSNIRTFKRRRTESDDLLTAKAFLAEDIARILVELTQQTLLETLQNPYLSGQRREEQTELFDRVRHDRTLSDSYRLAPVRSDLQPARRTSRPWEFEEPRPVLPPISIVSNGIEDGSRKRKFGEADEGLLRLTAAATSQPPELPSGKRRMDSPEHDTARDASHSPKAHRCPYFVRDKTGRTHPKCANRTFPNPRKLKEHVWQTTRPYKCNVCKFGFGRDKTRAIHVKERKKGCKPPPPGSALLRESYENSPEHIRDQRIEAARSTEEIVEILDDYERAKGPDALRDLPVVGEEEGSEVDSQDLEEREEPLSRCLFERSIMKPAPTKQIFSDYTLFRHDRNFPSKSQNFAHTSSANRHYPTPPHSRTSSQSHMTFTPPSGHDQPTPDLASVRLPPLKMEMRSPPLRSWIEQQRDFRIMTN